MAAKIGYRRWHKRSWQPPQASANRPGSVQRGAVRTRYCRAYGGSRRRILRWAPAQDRRAPPPPIPSTVPSQLLDRRRPDIASAERQYRGNRTPTSGWRRSRSIRPSGFPAPGGISGLICFRSLFTPGPARIWSAGPTVSPRCSTSVAATATVEQVQANYDALRGGLPADSPVRRSRPLEDNLVALRVLTTEAAPQIDKPR